jgi:hypothetical protein
MASAVPKIAQKPLGFTGCGKTLGDKALCQGTTSVVPIKALNVRGFNP